MTSRTILDLDLKKILSKIEKKYRVKLSRNVQAVDYGSERRSGGDLYIRFRHVEKPVGEPTEDGLVVLFYDEREDHGSGDQAVAVEVLDLNRLMRD
jgi:hypothetical protein